MTDLRKAAEQALEILDMCFYDEEDEVYCLGGWHQEKFMDAREALRQALAQSVDAVNMSQDRVYETDKFNHITVVCHEDHVVSYEDYAGKCLLCVVEDLMREVGRLTAVCKEKEWVGLTDDELEDLEFASVDTEYGHLDIRVLSKAIEAKLKEKNV